MGMSAYIDDLLKDYEMSECKPATRLPTFRGTIAARL